MFSAWECDGVNDSLLMNVMCRNEMTLSGLGYKKTGSFILGKFSLSLGFVSHTKGSKDMSSGTLWTGHTVRN